MNKTLTTAALILTATVAVGCQSFWPTRYERHDGNAVYLFQQDAELLTLQDAARAGRNQGYIAEAEVQKAWFLSALVAAGIPGAGVIGLLKKRPGDYSEAEMTEMIQDAIAEFTGEEVEEA